MTTRAQPAPVDERLWLLRAVLVLQSPRAVFAALRDDSLLVARARSEAITALVILAGMAAVLWTPTYGRLLDDPAYDDLLVAVVGFIGGAIYGTAVYWATGALLYACARSLGSFGSYRRARHVVAFAAAPIALSLILWPVRLSVYGDDVFRSGGGDAGAGNALFVALAAAFVAWALALLVVGVRTAYRFSWARTSAACALAAAVPALVALVGVLG